MISIMMLFIFVFTIPSMYIYHKYGAVKQDALDPFTQFSLGNMGNSHFKLIYIGGAETICVNIPLDPGDINIECHVGQL